MGSKAPPPPPPPRLFSHISNICISCIYIIEGSRKPPALQHFRNHFLSDIKIKIFINFWHFFLDVPSVVLRLIDTLSLQ